MRSLRVHAAIIVLAVVALRSVVACVDGVTPDCSDPAVCAPFEGDAAPLTTDSGAETSTTTDAASTSDAPADASSDG